MAACASFSVPVMVAPNRMHPPEALGTQSAQLSALPSHA